MQKILNSDALEYAKNLETELVYSLLWNMKVSPETAIIPDTFLLIVWAKYHLIDWHTKYRYYKYR